MAAPWEKYAQTEQQNPWDKYKKPETAPDGASRPLLTGDGILKSTVDQLPLYGSVGFGLLGLPMGGPIGAMAGAGVGAGLGKAAQNFINRYLEPENVKPMTEQYKDIGKEMLLGAAAEGGGQLLARGIGGLARMMPTKSAMAPAIEKAGTRLGVKPTEGMLTDSYFIKGLENDLAKSPTVGGALVRRETAPVQNKIDEITRSALNDASSLSKYEGGSDIKKGLIADISERYQPIQMAYDDVASSTKDIPIAPKSAGRVAKNIRNVEGANLFPEYRAEAETYASAIENAQSANDLKVIKTRAKEALRDPSLSADRKNIAAQALDKIDRLETNTIMREAVAQARTPKEGAKIGAEIVGNLKTAAKEYRAMMGDVGKLAKGSKITSGKYGISNVLKEIDEIPAEQLPEKLFKTNDTEFLNFIKEKHPDAYAEARKQKIADILKKSTSPQDGTISARRFLQAIKDLGPEVRQHLFGDAVNSLDDVQKLVQATPEVFNPSGTARSMQIKQVLNPITQAEDLGRYGLYKTLTKSKSLKPGLLGIEKYQLPQTGAKGLLMGNDNE